MITTIQKQKNKPYIMANSTVFHQSREVFKRQKKLCLSGIDNSRKGSIDEAIVNLVCFINGQSNYFTLSSCSGRIHLFEEVSV